MGGLQFVVPFRRHIGIADKHRRGFVAKSHRQVFHRPLILAEKHFGQRTKNQIAERKPMQPDPIRREIDAAFHIGHRRSHQPIREPRSSALHEFHPLIRQEEVDRRGERPSEDTFHPMKRAAVLRRSVSSHPETVRDRFKDLRLLMHTRITAPPRMNIGSMNRINETDDAIVRRAGIGQRNMERLPRFRWKRHARRWRQRIDMASFVGQIQPTPLRWTRLATFFPIE